MRETERQWIYFFAPYEVHTNPRREREARVLREEQEAPGQRLPGSSRVQGVSKRERAFVRGTSGERELGVQGLRVKSPLVKFFFHSEVCMPHGDEPFYG